MITLTPQMKQEEKNFSNSSFNEDMGFDQDWQEEEEDPATYEFEPGRVYWDEVAANP